MPERYDQELLDRFRPCLVYDRQYDYRALAVESAVANPGNLLRRRDGDVIARTGAEPPLTLEVLSAAGGYPSDLTAELTDCLCQAPDHPGDARTMEGDPQYAARLYGRCVDGDDGVVWLQYWFWLYYNPKHLFGFGKHEGDWEMVQLGVVEEDGGHRIVHVSYAQHDSGEARPPDGVEYVDGTEHPIAYVAPLSHASYFSKGAHPYLLGVDHPYGDGPSGLLPVVPFGAWKAWPGRWGTSENVTLGLLGNGPPSPAHQGTKWSDPGRWHAAKRWRRVRVWLGRLFELLGRRTYPPSPVLHRAVREPAGVRVYYEIGGRGLRRARHLYLTVHAGERVLESRAIRHAKDREPEELLLVPDGREALTVCASAYNRLRQRSDLTETPVGPAGPRAR